MKQRALITFLSAAAFCCATAQVTPKGTSAEHNDSCWYFTFDYETPDIGRNEGMLVVTHICTPDTCISSAKRHIQGKKYAKRYTRRFGNSPELVEGKRHYCTLSMPEEAATDTVWGITYSEYTGKDGVVFECDTVMICMPQASPMSCHRITAGRSMADHLAKEHPYVRSIGEYTPVNNGNIGDFGHYPAVVRYSTNSDKLNPEYLDNARNTDELMNIIENILADSTTTLQSIQLIGYSSPEEGESSSGGLGYSRAAALRNHIMSHHNIGDSIFEIYDGGKNWDRLYNDISELGIDDSDNIIEMLKSEPSGHRRSVLLKKVDNGELYTELVDNVFMHHRGTCCGGIYYQNRPDTVAVTLNEIVDELIYNPQPDYSALLDKLKEYKDDPRVLNLQGVIDYRRHRRHAAEKAFAEAAAMGDEQAAVNLQIVENNRNK